ncbi:hypothetical protein A1F94_013784 [Pyrenophora tritici-repentis]|uniref:PspE, Rhodanese-related sulfurtransferase n=1 Tax=Pyrenophora tritici-repentis TaxID=45151 RepID=A0A317AB54_9PLEO|nr:Rhodanese-like protein [Pyrenophora tritici-repentis]KAF7450308.1 Rhodanese protein [Pyrenophora tritici-repentis]KAF7572889.1 PspE, Rhodanese-related sulfurtransferase [Pyrenophora tritici-repentis]KAG9375646.1 hypothetical protein A1F94_013784 [Pyrenophora tritici-repentis]
MSSKHFLKLLGSTPRSQTSVIGRQPDLLSRIVGSQAVHGGPPFAQKKSIHSWCNTEPTFLITNPLQITQTQHFHPSPRSLRSSPSSTENKLYEFDDVLHILEHPSDSRLLIDVREPHEYDANNIPTAINIPVTSHPDALLLPEEEFGEQFGFEKPPRGKEVVFFCKAGVRSRAAAGIARQAGYVNVGEYRGSWLDWQKRGGPGTKPTARTGSSGEENLGPDGKPEYPPGGLMGTKQ